MSIHMGRSLHRLRLLGWLLAGLLLGVLLPAGALAAVVRQGGTVVIGPEEVINEDLYAVGNSVLIQGTVRGDVATAARRVEIAGTVEGDVLSMAADTSISGRVGGSIRAAGGTLVLAGEVEEDAVLAGAEVRLAPNARVGRDAFLAASEATVQAPVGGDVQAAAETLTLGAPVAGSVRAEAGTLRVTEAADIRGSLRYRAGGEVEIASGAMVAGPLERLSPTRRPGEGPLMYLVGWLRALVGLFALGLLLVLLLPDFSRRVPVMLIQAPWRSLGWGAITFVGLPIAAAIIFLVGLVLGGWWIGLLILGLYAAALALCFPVVGMFLGRWVLERFGKAGPSLVLALLLGLVMLTLVGLVPVLGGLVMLATVLFGLGALVLTAAQRRRVLGAPAHPRTA